MDMRSRYDLLMDTAERAPNGCLISTIGSHHEGYRRVEVGGRHMLAHRLVMEVTLGRALLPRPAEVVDHTCHNTDVTCPGGYDCPHRSCIDPGHLRVTDVVTNWRAGRQGAPALRRAITHCPKGHPYEEGNLRSSKSGARACLTCHRERERARRAAARA